MKKHKKILVTCALPYANGSIHLGHMLEHIEADIWVRYQRMIGNTVYFICADDAHGTPIMLKAQKLGISSEQLIKNMYLEHKKDFYGFNISYDNYHSTHSKENFKLSKMIYYRLKKNNFIKLKTISQFFDTEKNMFLPDRFVKGTCPKCSAHNQYGDNCEICGAHYNPTDIINPKSAISNSIPIMKESDHLFFDLPNFSNMLNSWIHSGVMQKSVVNKLQEWCNLGLQQWNISRDSPYFGFEIPDMPGKYFYVWLDAPIGYMSAIKNFCMKNTNINFNDFWNINSSFDLCHFIGKDIVYFHALFWPAILEGSKFRKPSYIFVHGHVTLNGIKMSKSHGTIIKASTYLSHLNSDCLRYYYASKLSSKINDIDLNLKDFVQKINTDIVNKIVNLASRNAKFINKYFDNCLSNILANPKLYKKFVESASSIGEAYHNRNTSKAIRKIIDLTNLANIYIQKEAPWEIAKQNERKIDLHIVCSMGIQLFRILITYLKPILPILAIRSENFLCTKLSWNTIAYPLLSHKINIFTVLFKRIKKTQIESIKKDLKNNNKN